MRPADSADYVVVGGPLAAAGGVLLDAVRREARRRALAAPFGEVRFDYGALGEAAPVPRVGVPRHTLCLTSVSTRFPSAGGRPLPAGVGRPPAAFTTLRGCAWPSGGSRFPWPSSR